MSFPYPSAADLLRPSSSIFALGAEGSLSRRCCRRHDFATVTAELATAADSARDGCPIDFGPLLRAFPYLPSHGSFRRLREPAYRAARVTRHAPPHAAPDTARRTPREI